MLYCSARSVYVFFCAPFYLLHLIFDCFFLVFSFVVFLEQCESTACCQEGYECVGLGANQCYWQVSNNLLPFIVLAFFFLSSSSVLLVYKNKFVCRVLYMSVKRTVTCCVQFYVRSSAACRVCTSSTLVKKLNFFLWVSPADPEVENRFLLLSSYTICGRSPAFRAHMFLTIPPERQGLGYEGLT